jgi:small-conductance mechanosensitive channel
VTNWTLSNCERLIEIPVAVAPSASPEKVINLLTQTVKSHPKVLANPPPQTLLVTFAAAAMSFRVRSWIDSEEDWMVVTSELSIAITGALAKEGIAMT